MRPERPQRPNDSNTLYAQRVLKTSHPAASAVGVVHLQGFYADTMALLASHDPAWDVSGRFRASSDISLQISIIEGRNSLQSRTGSVEAWGMAKASATRRASSSRGA